MGPLTLRHSKGVSGGGATGLDALRTPPRRGQPRAQPSPHKAVVPAEAPFRHGELVEPPASHSPHRHSRESGNPWWRGAAGDSRRGAFRSAAHGEALEPAERCTQGMGPLTLRHSKGVSGGGGQRGSTLFGRLPVEASLVPNPPPTKPSRQPRPLSAMVSLSNHPRRTPPTVIPAKAGIQGGAAGRWGPSPTTDPITLDETPTDATLPTLAHMAVAPATLCHPSLAKTAYAFYSYGHQPPMKAAREVGCRRQPVRWRRRTGRQRAVVGEGTPGETAAGERRRGRRYGADVPALTGPGFVLTMWGASYPDGGAVAGEPRRASGARASAAVGAMSFLVLRSRSGRCHRLSVERPPVHATARTRPRNPPPPHGRRASDSRESGNPGWRRGASLTPSRSDPQHSRRGKEAPMPAGGRRPGPAGGPAGCSLQEQPPPRPSAEDAAGSTRPGKGPGRKSIKGGPSNSFGKGAPPGNNSCFAPRPASKDDKKRRTILQRESIKWHCS